MDTDNMYFLWYNDLSKEYLNHKHTCIVRHYPYTDITGWSETFNVFLRFFGILINLQCCQCPSLESLNFNLNVIIPPYCMWIMWWGSMHPVRRDRFAPINTDKNIFCFNPLIIQFGVCIVCIEHSVSDLEHLSQLILHDDKNSKYYIINCWLVRVS